MSEKPQTYDIEEIKRRLPMMDLLERDGVRMRRAGSGWQGCCPFHEEKTGSFNVGSERPDRARCFGCGWNGDVVDYWKQSRGLEFGDSVAQLASLVGLAPRTVGVAWKHGGKLRKAPKRIEERVKPLLPAMRMLKDSEIEQLAKLRQLSPRGVHLASLRKRVGWALWPQQQRCELHGWECFMKGDDCHGGKEFRTTKWSVPCWAVTDSTRNVVQFRRLDGGVFYDKPDLRMITKGSPTWPIGASEIETRDNVILCEGGADMLAAFHFISGLCLDHAVAVCCILGAGNRIADDALPFFKGKMVRVIADADPVKELVTKHVNGTETVRKSMPGFDAALRWKEQLRGAGACAEVYDLRGIDRADGKPVKDLNDMALCNAATVLQLKLCDAFTEWKF